MYSWRAVACCVPNCGYFFAQQKKEKKNRIWLQKFNEAKFFTRKKEKLSFFTTTIMCCKYENHYHMLMLTMLMLMADKKKERKKFMNLISHMLACKSKKVLRKQEFPLKMKKFPFFYERKTNLKVHKWNFYDSLINQPLKKTSSSLANFSFISSFLLIWNSNVCDFTNVSHSRTKQDGRIIKSKSNFILHHCLCT